MAVQTNAADIHLRSSNAMGLNVQTPFSITCWINATWNSGTTISMVGIYGPATDTPLATPITALQIGTKTGTYDLSTWTWGGGTMVQTAANYMLGKNGIWTMISYTFDGTNHNLYVNDVLAATATSTQIPGYLNQVYINGFPTGATSETASFQVDQYALYRRTLSSDEVKTIFNSSGHRHGICFDLVCRYEFDELSQGNAVSFIPDLSGNGHSLTPTGAGAAMSYNYVNTLANSNIRPVQ